MPEYFIMHHEFVLIAHPARENDLLDLIKDIRYSIRVKCENENKPYVMSMGVGFDKLVQEQDAFSRCMKKADDKMYQDKERLKQSGQRAGER